MKRSLKLRIFAFVFLGVAIFVLASRLTIRYSASAPLITYQSELFGRQITRIGNSHGDKTAIEKLQTHLVYAIEGLQPDEILVFSSQDAINGNFSASLLTAAQQKPNGWKLLDDQLENAVSMSLESAKRWQNEKEQVKTEISYWQPKVDFDKLN